MPLVQRKNCEPLVLGPALATAGNTTEEPQTLRQPALFHQPVLTAWLQHVWQQQISLLTAEDALAGVAQVKVLVRKAVSIDGPAACAVVIGEIPATQSQKDR